MDHTKKKRRTTRSRGLFGSVTRNQSGALDTTKSSSSPSKSQISNAGSAPPPDAKPTSARRTRAGSSTPAAISAAGISVEPDTVASSDDNAEGMGLSVCQPQSIVARRLSIRNSNGNSNGGNGNSNGSGNGGGERNGDGAGNKMNNCADVGESSGGDGVEEIKKYTPGAYMQREEDFIRHEENGEYTFPYVMNDGKPENVLWLVALKGVYSRQLPNMPKDYICRLVLNRNHRSVAILKRDGSILGGITYRTFPGQSFGEIAFCAVIGTEQVKGFGTRLMNHTKEYAQTQDNISHFLTYADNNAVGYFLKQGFTKEITLHRDVWSGYIKDYDGGTLMEFVFHSGLAYTNLPRMIRRQRAVLDRNIREKSKSHVEHPGLSLLGKRKAIAIEEIPGVRDAGWKPTPPNKNQKLRVKDQWVPASKANMHNFMQEVLTEVGNHADAWPFKEPVDPNDVPDYYDLVKNPVDLSLMQSRLDSRQYYLTLDILKADFQKMFNNCRYYNATDTIYYKLANRLEGFVEEYFRKCIMGSN
ncbi:hypothetical protein BSKO_05272 [Bryopsis sp. KO-2023]|nr:hypothetical protein BSKO_05272 [Bryopsis sp. KO-2023]